MEKLVDDEESALNDVAAGDLAAAQRRVFGPDASTGSDDVSALLDRGAQALAHGEDRLAALILGVACEEVVGDPQLSLREVVDASVHALEALSRLDQKVASPDTCVVVAAASVQAHAGLLPTEGAVQLLRQAGSWSPISPKCRGCVGLRIGQLQYLDGRYAEAIESFVACQDVVQASDRVALWKGVALAANAIGDDRWGRSACAKLRQLAEDDLDLGLDVSDALREARLAEVLAAGDVVGAIDCWDVVTGGSASYTDDRLVLAARLVEGAVAKGLRDDAVRILGAVLPAASRRGLVSVVARLERLQATVGP